MQTRDDAEDLLTTVLGMKKGAEEPSPNQLYLKRMVEFGTKLYLSLKVEEAEALVCLPVLAPPFLRGHHSRPQAVSAGRRG